jgi:hypothetical protein
MVAETHDPLEFAQVIAVPSRKIIMGGCSR